MSVDQDPSPIVPSATSPSRFARVEYLDFQDLAEHREYRLRVCRPDGSTESRFLIANAAFDDRRVKLQDGPDVCYQKLLKAVSVGEAPSPGVVTVDDMELAAYRVAHTPVKKHRSPHPFSSPTPAPVARPPARVSAPRLPVAGLVTRIHTEPALQEGQRVSHALFGVGVTGASTPGHTKVAFDQDGAKTFVTALVKLDVLSAPHTWETSPRGSNRPCRSLSAPAPAQDAK
jgi:hypothetical protein